MEHGHENTRSNGCSINIIFLALRSRSDSQIPNDVLYSTTTPITLLVFFFSRHFRDLLCLRHDKWILAAKHAIAHSIPDFEPIISIGWELISTTEMISTIFVANVMFALQTSPRYKSIQVGYRQKTRTRFSPPSLFFARLQYWGLRLHRQPSYNHYKYPHRCSASLETCPFYVSLGMFRNSSPRGLR